jgi:hypothetical protein
LHDRPEPDHPQIGKLHDLLLDLVNDRNALAHAIWHEHGEQLHGTFTRRRDKKHIQIRGDQDLDKMIAMARYCTAITDFWRS